MTKFAAAVVLLAALRGCGVETVPPSGEGRLFQGAIACRQTAGTAVARTEKELAALWYDATCSNTDIPSVDFDRDMVVAYFLGERPTTGYTVDIKNVDVTDLGLLLHPLITTPGKGCIVGQSLTYPVVVVRLAKHAGSVAVGAPETQAKDCQ